MPSLALGTAAGAGGPLADILDRIAREQAMREGQRRLEEEVRSHLSNETLRRREIDQMASDRGASRDIASQAQSNLERSRLDTEAKSRIALRTIGSSMTSEERTSDRGQAPESAYQFQPQNMGASVQGNPELGQPGGELGPTPTGFKWMGTEPQLQAQQRIDKPSGSDNVLTSTDKGLRMRSDVIKGLKGGEIIQPFVPPDRTVMSTAEGFIPRPDVTAAAKRGEPLQQVEPAAIRTRKDMATRVKEHVPDAMDLIEEADKRGLLGPALGRWADLLANKLGSTGNEDDDDLMGQLSFVLSGLRTGFANVHGGARGGGSIQMAAMWKEVFDSKQMSKARLMGALKEEQKWLTGYAGGKGKEQPTKPAGIRYDLNGNRIP